MKRLIFTLIAFCSACSIGCSSSSTTAVVLPTSERIIGTWKLDREGKVDVAMQNITLEFKTDGKLIMAIGGQSVKELQYTLDGDTLSITHPGETTPEVKTVKSLADDTLILSADKKEDLEYKKKK